MATTRATTGRKSNGKDDKKIKYSDNIWLSDVSREAGNERTHRINALGDSDDSDGWPSAARRPKSIMNEPQMSRKHDFFVAAWKYSHENHSYECCSMSTGLE